MVVAGPTVAWGRGNRLVLTAPTLPRRVAHPPPSQEIFFQLSGAMTVEAMERGARKPVPIPEGHIFCLPGRIPHSPQRLAGTVGLVIERDRLPGEIDGLRWCVQERRRRRRWAAG